MTSLQTDHTGWLRHRKHSIPLMQRWYHKNLSIPWSTPLHNNVIQTKKLHLYLSYRIKPHSSRNPTWWSLWKQSTVTEREKPIAHEHTRIGPNRPQPINQSEMVYTNQSELAIRDQSDHSICALTNYYWSVTNAYDWSILTNQKITLIIFWLVKNGKDKIRTSHWSRK